MTDFATKYGPWALVAGASDGVGEAFADALAARGLNVVLLARRQAVLDRVAADIGARHGVQTRTLAVDLAQSGAAAAVAEATADLTIGFLVYCAGADPDFAPFLSNSIDAAEAMVYRNCLAPMRLCHHFAPAMVERGSGGIVVFGSGAGFVGGPNMVAYGASKADQAHQVRLLAAELGEHGIRVNGINPDGVVRGSGIFAGGWGAKRAAVYGVPEEELGEYYAQRTLLKREVLPEHVAAAVFALTAGDLSQTTGLHIPVDAGVPAAFLR